MVRRSILTPLHLTALTAPYLVENFPGFPTGVLGPELMDKFREQSIRFGTRVVTETVSRVDLSSRPFKYWSDSPEPNTADAIIIATGASAKRLGLKGEELYWQSGISACAVCDGAVPIFRFLFFFLFILKLLLINRPLQLSPSTGINLSLSSEEATQQLRKPHV